MSDRKTGRVKWFSKQKGFGFVTANDGGDFFVHFSSIEGGGYKCLSEGDTVTFNSVKTEKGEQAVEVVKQ